MRIAFWSVAMAIAEERSCQELYCRTIARKSWRPVEPLLKAHHILSHQGGRATAATGSFLIVSAVGAGGTNITIIQ